MEPCLQESAGVGQTLWMLCKQGACLTSSAGAQGCTAPPRYPHIHTRCVNRSPRLKLLFIMCEGPGDPGPSNSLHQPSAAGIRVAAQCIGK